MAKKHTPAFEAGQAVTFTGFTGGDDLPEHADLLTEGKKYIISSVVDPEEGDEDDAFGFLLQVENPEFNKKKKASKTNVEFLEVDTFTDEIAAVAAEGEGEDGEEEALAYADVKKGDVICAVQGDTEVTGTITKRLKVKFTVQDADEEEHEFLVKNTDIYAVDDEDAGADADVDEEDAEEEDDEPLEYDDVKKGDEVTVTVIDGDSEVTGEVTKRTKVKFTVTDAEGEDHAFSPKKVDVWPAAEVTEEDDEEPLSYDDVAKGDDVVVVDGDDEFSGAVIKRTKVKLTVENDEGDTREFTAKKVDIFPADEAGEEENDEAEEDTSTASTDDDHIDPEAKDMVRLDNEDAEILALVEESDDLCELVEELDEESTLTQYRLGGLLYHVRMTGAYRSLDTRYEEKGGFGLYMEERLATGYRMGLHYIDVYTAWNQAGLSAELVGDIGISKAIAISKALTQANAAALVKLAQESTVRDLKDTIKESYSGGAGTPDKEIVRRTTFRFRLLEEAGGIVTDYMEQAKEHFGCGNMEDTFEAMATDWASSNLDVASTKKIARQVKARLRQEAEDRGEVEDEPVTEKKSAPKKKVAPKKKPSKKRN